MEWIINNLVNIVVVAAIFVCAVLAAVKIIRDKHKGKCSCGGNCNACVMNKDCRKR